MGLSSGFVYHVYVCVIKLYCVCWNTWRVRSLKMWEIVLGHWRRWGVSKGCQSLQWVGDASGWTSSCSHRGRCIPRERICPLHQNHLFKAQRFKIQNPTDPSIKLAYICLFFRTWFEGWFLSNADVYEYILLKKSMTTVQQNAVLMCSVIMFSEFIFPEYSYHRIIQGILIIFKILFKIFFKSKQS